MRSTIASSTCFRTKVIPPESAPCARAGPSAPAPWARLANSAQPPIARTANVTCVALARTSLAREKLGSAMMAGPALRIDVLGHAIPAIAWPLVWGFAGVLALLSLGALAATLLPLLRPGGDFTNLRQRV